MIGKNKWIILLIGIVMPTDYMLCSADDLPDTKQREIIKAYQEIHKELHHEYEQWRDVEQSSDAKFVKSLNGIWGLIGESALSYLNAHPNAGIGDMKAYLNKIDPTDNCPVTHNYHKFCPLDTDVLMIGKGLTRAYIIAPSYHDSVGTFFFIVPSETNGNRIVWRLCDAEKGPSESGGYSELPCSHRPFGIHLLPVSESENPKFYINAYEPQDMGLTMTYQISIWEWTGEEAKLLFIGYYAFMIDTETDIKSVEYKDGILRILIKDEFKTMGTYGCSDEPQAIWKLRITPTEVTDMGKERFKPELHFIDDLNYRVSKRKSAKAIAAPQVVRKLRYILKDSEYDTFHNCSIRHIKDNIILCLTTLNLGTLEYTMKKKSTGLYVIKVKKRNSECSHSNSKSF